MDKIKDLVELTTKEKQNASSNNIDLESRHLPLTATKAENKPSHIATNERSGDKPLVQNDASSNRASASDPPKTNKQDQGKKSHPQGQNIKEASAAEVDPKAKKAKKRLRKGKWTIEEEEYTSRIIQYFSTGLLTLPDGATLRSYLAEKLNCDPMRITKKFTGACCLGRRAYHLRDRPRASPAEIEMASFELLHLEQRFRLRVEHEQTGLPLPPRHELLASQPTPAAAIVPPLFTLQQAAPTAKAANHWIQNPVLAPSPGHSSLLPGLTGVIPNATIPNPANTNINLQNSSLLLAAGQLLLQNQTGRTQAGNPSAAAAAAATAPLQMLNNLVASYALSRAISQQQAGISILQPPGSNAPSIGSTTVPKETNQSSSPPADAFKFNIPDSTTNAIKKPSQTPVIVQSQEGFSKQVHSQPQRQHDKIDSSAQTPQVSKKEEHTKKLKAAFEEQQRALRIAYEKSLRNAQEWEEKAAAPKTSQATSDTKDGKPSSDAKSTSSTSKASPDTMSPAEQLQRSYEAHLASLQRSEQQASLKAISEASLVTSSQPKEGQRGNAESRDNGRSSQKKSQDEEAGAILLGFLNSLRESFEDAIEDKDRKNVSQAMPTPSAQQGSSTKMTKVSSGSIPNVVQRRNVDNDDHPNTSIKSRRQTSDPITSLSHFQATKRKIKPASVTETSSSTSSQPTIDKPSSSQEDSNSDKMGNSSSEDSDKEITASTSSSKGPPRKRLKDFHQPHEFTRENLMAHSKRMDMECGQSSDVSSSDD